MAKDNVAQALDAFLKEYHDTRIDVWVNSGHVTDPAHAADFDSISAFLFPFIRSTHLIMIGIDDMIVLLDPVAAKAVAKNTAAKAAKKTAAVAQIAASAEEGSDEQDALHGKSPSPLLDDFSPDEDGDKKDHNNSSTLPRTRRQRATRALVAACRWCGDWLVSRWAFGRWRQGIQFGLAGLLASLFVVVDGADKKYPSGYWAAFTVAIVAGDTLGGSFHQSMLRWHGTVAGAIVG